jgi:L-histidine N-alpha-methyltransferase
MIPTQNKTISSKQQFYSDTLKGLKSTPKFMSSKYFYDQQGDKLFQQIMAAEEYYLTDSEMEILIEQSAQISKAIGFDGQPFDLIELGAGDATKSIHLLKQMMQNKLDFRYLPVDISENVINNLSNTLPDKIPGLNMEGLNGDYFDMLERVSELSNRRKVILFMGANIGNMTVDEAGMFCRKLKNFLSKDDLVIVGFDLKKNPKQILAAYDDREGITKAFNLNLLNRINNELGGDFELDNFEHYASYDPESGACKSYLISLKEQQIRLGDTESISFDKNEYIYMEISQKYALNEIEELAKSSGFKPVTSFFDRKKYFIDSLWRVD